jgi:hypothetical protein
MKGREQEEGVHPEARPSLHDIKYTVTISRSRNRRKVNLRCCRFSALFREHLGPSVGASAGLCYDLNLRDVGIRGWPVPSPRRGAFCLLTDG